jgi:membrane protein YqaA with SNARE-associated domain
MVVFAFLQVLDRAKNWFLAFGPVGAFLLALVDSFVPLPGGADFAVVTLSTARPEMAPVAVAATTAGSVLGSTLFYLAARRAGVAALARVSAERRERVEHLLGRYDMLALGTAALLPPPFPFKVFNLVAGVLEIHVWRFVAAIAVGRLLRFGLEAALAIRYGAEALALLSRHGLKVLAALAVVGLAAWAYRSFTARRATAAGGE